MNRPAPIRGKFSLRAAVLHAFSQSREEVTASLRPFRERDWRINLQWLDTSGLALYLLDHLTSLGCENLLPPSVLARLQQNLVDNTARNHALLFEAAEVNLGLQRDGVRFAHLKGITLWPESVPNPALRCQLDLDFLVCEDDITTAAKVLESLGYKLHCVSGNTWEFKAGESRLPSLRDLYKTKPQRSAELHLSPATRLLEHVQLRSFSGHSFPVLAPVDAYLNQSLHLFKHVCSSFTRAAWLLEFRRHTLARNTDTAWWQHVEERAMADPALAIALTTTLLLSRKIFGDTPPALLPRLMAAPVVPAVELWIDLYGRATLMADFPGTKHYLLLQSALDPKQRTARRQLLPLRLPRPVTKSSSADTLLVRLRRGLGHAGFVGSRLRFHCLEGVRHLIEAPRFRRHLAGLIP